MCSCLDRLATLAVPTVALMNGHAYGGGAEVAVACDMRLAADDISIAFNQVALAIMPAWGGIERLTALVGRGRALHLLLTGRVLLVAQAGAIGLVEQVVPRAEFEVEGQALLRTLAAVQHDQRSSRSGCRRPTVASPIPITSREANRHGAASHTVTSANLVARVAW